MLSVSTFALENVTSGTGWIWLDDQTAELQNLNFHFHNGIEYSVVSRRRPVGMYYPSGSKSLNAKIQAPFVLAEVRALRQSIFKSSPEVQRAIAIADKVEQSYDLQRSDLFIPALETFCAILEPFAMT